MKQKLIKNSAFQTSFLSAETLEFESEKPQCLKQMQYAISKILFFEFKQIIFVYFDGYKNQGGIPHGCVKMLFD